MLKAHSPIGYIFHIQPSQISSDTRMRIGLVALKPVVPLMATQFSLEETLYLGVLKCNRRFLVLVVS